VAPYRNRKSITKNVRDSPKMSDLNGPSSAATLRCAEEEAMGSDDKSEEYMRLYLKPPGADGHPHSRIASSALIP